VIAVCAVDALKLAPLTVNATVYVPGSRPTVPNTNECPWPIGWPLMDHWKPNWVLSAPTMDAFTCAVSPWHNSCGVAVRLTVTFRFGHAVSAGTTVPSGHVFCG